MSVRHMTVALLLIATACTDGTAPHSSIGVTPGGTIPASLDSLAGTVGLVADGSAAIAIRTVNGLLYSVVGATELLSHVEGTDVMVYGEYIDFKNFRVLDFEVRGADGLPAWDGLLQCDVAGCALRQRNGSRTLLVNPPESLVAMSGYRVWIAGQSLLDTPSAFGIIADFTTQ